jgi:hypothetical protein
MSGAQKLSDLEKFDLFRWIFLADMSHHGQIALKNTRAPVEWATLPNLFVDL